MMEKKHHLMKQRVCKRQTKEKNHQEWNLQNKEWNLQEKEQKQEL